MKKAVVLLSGGLDSTVLLHLVNSQGYEVIALSFDYGQRHSRELNAARAVSDSVGVSMHQIIRFDLSSWGGSALTNNQIDIEPGDVTRTNIPLTYVPARNMIFLSLAASLAEATGTQDIFIGVSQVDYSGYVDCRQEFIEAMESAINAGTAMAAVQGKSIKVHAPFMHQTKAEEIRLGISLGVDFSLTWSCYHGGEKPCRECDSCLLREKAFQEAGISDPLIHD